MTKLVTARGPDELRARFEAWLRRRTGQGDIAISEFRRATEGMSSETLLVDVDGLGEGTASFVVRVQPAPQQQVYLDADV
ncbi:MAG: hypothetical protein JWR63_1412, partial [Conexibacter sp.]|nr:hypothetical protein [Conexibacter sp.]